MTTMELKSIRLSPEDINVLRGKFEKLDDVAPFDADIKLAAQIASYGIYREVGTVNDELARFIFDATTKTVVPRESLRAELVEWNGLVGLRIWSTVCSTIELRTKGFYELVHPGFSRNPDGTLHDLVVFPEIVARIARLQGVELVLVKSWGLNSIFGGFDPAKGYYQTNFWELENNDTLRFASLIKDGRVALMGTHDLIAHIADLNGVHWPQLRAVASDVHDAIQNYFQSTKHPTISALILPYTIGVVLDDLAQPPSYGSQSHLAVLHELLERLARKQIPASLRTMLTRFPDTFQTIIEMSRTQGIERDPKRIAQTTETFIQDILKASLTVPTG